MSDLYIIEAPKKAQTLEASLSLLGLDAKVIATKGHLLSMPDSLYPLGIDAAFRDFERKPREVKIVERIREQARQADRVMIATDDDTEGHVIAWDVAEVIRDIHPRPFRVRLKGIDAESVKEAIDQMSFVRKEDAIPGRTRAIIDRMIGAVFSGNGVVVGRVGTALLGTVAKEKPSVARLRLVSPAKDGGRPWVADMDIVDPITRDIADRLAELALPSLDAKAVSREFSAPPGNMGDIMVRAGDVMDMSPKEAARALQRNYEVGKMSYPRAGSRGISKSASRKMARVLKSAGYRFSEDNVAEKPSGEPHDAPHPIGRVHLSHDPRKLGHDEGVRTLVARDLIKSGQKHKLEIAEVAPVRSFLISQGFEEKVVSHVCRLHWRREQGPRYPGQTNWPQSEIVIRRPDTVILEMAVKAGLGKPSTWANHVDTFIQRELVDEDLNLTRKGQEWLASSPPELTDARVAAAIERACENIAAAQSNDPEREPWEVLAQKIVSKLPEAIRAPLVEAVAHEAPRAKVDVLDEYGLKDVEPEIQSEVLARYTPPEE